MQSYGSCELLADMGKITKDKKIADLYKKICDFIDDDFEGPQGVGSDESPEELKEMIGLFTELVLRKYGVNIYHVYIPSDAEGTDYAGELKWCLYAELVPKVGEVADQWTTWSEFG